MGGGKGGEFGNTRGSTLDAISNWLAVASLIPGLDTFTDIASIPVDLLRGDYVSAGLDLIGIIPLIGEVGDAAKLARVADNIIDASKAVNKASDVANTTKKASKIPRLPKSPSSLKKNGWKDITPSGMKNNTTSRTYSKGKWTIRYDKGIKGAGGYSGKDHYHILNPNSTGKHDYYLDKYGNPVPKNSKKSHILP